jgi:hypothetical protein
MGFSQSKTTKQVKESIDLNIPSSGQITPSKLREVLHGMNGKTQIVPDGYVAPVATTTIAKADFDNSLETGIGGFTRNPKLKILYVQNATSYDVSVSKDINFATGFTFILTPTTGTVRSYRQYLQMSSLDTNSVYYYRYRGRNATNTGAWSDAKRFDTYPKPAGFSYLNSVFDLIEYDVSYDLAGRWSMYDEVNKEYPTLLRVADKQVFMKHIKASVTNFPLTLLTNVSQILYEGETSCWTNYTWGKAADYIDVAPYTSISSNNFVLTNPVTMFPIQSINFYSTIFYTK